MVKGSSSIMATKKQKSDLKKVGDIKLDKISVFFKRPILKNIMKILLMEHPGFRSYKAVKNINILFNNIDVTKYSNNQELLSYIWCIKYVSKKWLDGYTTPELIAEIAKREPEYDNIKADIINSSINDPNIITSPEVKSIYDLIAEALQYGYITALKDQYIDLLDDIDMDKPGAFKEIVDRLFLVSKSLLDIQHNTNLVANKITFNTSDPDSVRTSISQTMQSLTASSNLLKVGIRRLNTLLSPAYMNGRLYVYAGAVGSGKSIMLQKTAIDIRKYNPDYQPRTPGMKPCVLYITMENFFTEVIERLWNMEFDEPMTNYSEEEATDMICDVLGITKVLKEDVTVKDENSNSLEAQLIKEPKNKSNIEIVMKYFSYREISTDDLFTLVQDLRDENMEVCAIVLDYMKRIAPAVPTPDNEKLELNHISNELKALAVILDIPVITAHQLNRAAAGIMDNVVRLGKADPLKQVGREHIGTAWEVCETADFVCLCNITYKPGTDDKFMELSVVKRRRIDQSEAEFAKFTYLAHPFAKNNGLRLIDDMNLDKVLSLQSLVSDIDIIGKEKANATKRIKLIQQSDFVEYDDEE
jgi:replicative DNA helicase